MDGQRSQKIRNGYKYLFSSAHAKWEKHGGKICTIVGTTGLFLSGVHACRTTYKKHDKLKQYGEEYQKAIADIKDEKWFRKALKTAKAGSICAAKVSKEYLPDILGAALSGYVNSKGWGIEHDHYEKTATMLGVLAADFTNYRRNVIREQGAAADKRYLTTKNADGKLIDVTDKDGKKISTKEAESEGVTVFLDPNSLRIWYSKETTPLVWDNNLKLRLLRLDSIRNDLDIDLIYGGHYSINDVRRKFLGKKGDVAEGGMFGRIWDPGNPEHPERGRKVNLHYEEDIDFMEGRTEGCWIIIDIDEEPLFESLSTHKKRKNGFE